jgi:hypothetical protein
VYYSRLDLSCHRAEKRALLVCVGGLLHTPGRGFFLLIHGHLELLYRCHIDVCCCSLSQHACAVCLVEQEVVIFSRWEKLFCICNNNVQCFVLDGNKIWTLVLPWDRVLYELCRAKIQYHISVGEQTRAVGYVTWSYLNISVWPRPPPPSPPPPNCPCIFLDLPTYLINFYCTFIGFEITFCWQPIDWLIHLFYWRRSYVLHCSAFNQFIKRILQVFPPPLSFFLN